MSRDNTNKKNIVNNISNVVGIPSSYAAKLLDDLIFILTTNVFKNKYLKIKSRLKKRKLEILFLELQQILFQLLHL